MRKIKKILKWTAVLLLSLIVIIVTFGFWFKNLIPEKDLDLANTTVLDLPYLSENIISQRGKILAVVTNTDTMGNSEEITGYELTELARAYYVFQANGFEVDVASPKGGKPPVVIDDEDMGKYDFAFLNDVNAQSKTNHTIPLNKVIPEDYEAVFFVGGKGAMFDFPNNEIIQSLVKEYYETNKVVSAVCHGPSALVNVTLDDGQPLIKNKRISGFTNKEELLLIPEAESIFPFLLQDKMVEQGAKFNEGEMYLENTSYDNNLITGQNPWSTWSVAENVIKQLGFTPKYREITDEENAVKVLSTYQSYGKNEAKKLIKTTIDNDRPVSRLLIAKHSIMAAMQGELNDFRNIISLVSYAKKCESKKKEKKSNKEH